jgi:hypothetical protein
VFATLSSLLRSKKGFISALLLFYGVVHGAFDILQDATNAASNWGTIVGFLTSGLGNLLVVVAGILLLLWAVVTRPPETDPINAPDTATPSQSPNVEALEAENQQLRENNQQHKNRLIGFKKN